MATQPVGGYLSVPQQLPNGNLLVPKRIEADDGTIGDTLVEIAPDDPMFDTWQQFLAAPSV